MKVVSTLTGFSYNFFDKVIATGHEAVLHELLVVTMLDLKQVYFGWLIYMPKGTKVAIQVNLLWQSKHRSPTESTMWF